MIGKQSADAVRGFASDQLRIIGGFWGPKLDPVVNNPVVRESLRINNTVTNFLTETPGMPGHAPTQVMKAVDQGTQLLNQGLSKGLNIDPLWTGTGLFAAEALATGGAGTLRKAGKTALGKGDDLLRATLRALPAEKATATGRSLRGRGGVRGKVNPLSKPDAGGILPLDRTPHKTSAARSKVMQDAGYKFNKSMQTKVDTAQTGGTYNTNKAKRIYTDRNEYISDATKWYSDPNSRGTMASEVGVLAKKKPDGTYEIATAGSRGKKTLEARSKSEAQNTALNRSLKLLQQSEATETLSKFNKLNKSGMKGHHANPPGNYDAFYSGASPEDAAWLRNKQRTELIRASGDADGNHTLMSTHAHDGTSGKPGGYHVWDREYKDGRINPKRDEFNVMRGATKEQRWKALQQFHYTEQQAMDQVRFLEVMADKFPDHPGWQDAVKRHRGFEDFQTNPQWSTGSTDLWPDRPPQDLLPRPK